MRCEYIKRFPSVTRQSQATPRHILRVHLFVFKGALTRTSEHRALRWKLHGALNSCETHRFSPLFAAKMITSSLRERSMAFVGRNQLFNDLNEICVFVCIMRSFPSRLPCHLHDLNNSIQFVIPFGAGGGETGGLCKERREIYIFEIGSLCAYWKIISRKNSACKWLGLGDETVDAFYDKPGWQKCSLKTSFHFRKFVKSF